jgi:transposase InsO family protein
MSDLYHFLGITKQSFYEQRKRVEQQKQMDVRIVKAVTKIRKQHPQMGARKVYHKVQEQFAIGRDRFESRMFALGFKLSRKRAVHKTTIWGKWVHGNLIAGKSINDLNQVWVSDLTYINLRGRHYYLISIMDLYSRRILGLSLSNRLTTETTLVPVFEQALQVRGAQKSYSGLIFHSDRGGQYIAGVFLDRIKPLGIEPSMAYSAYENANEERLHGTLKYEYIFPSGIEDPAMLKSYLPKLMFLYNQDRPHLSLQMQTPFEFECALKSIPLEQRTVLKIPILDQFLAKK